MYGTPFQQYSPHVYQCSFLLLTSACSRKAKFLRSPGSSQFGNPLSACFHSCVLSACNRSSCTTVKLSAGRMLDKVWTLVVFEYFPLFVPTLPRRPSLSLSHWSVATSMTLFEASTSRVASIPARILPRLSAMAGDCCQMLLAELVLVSRLTGLRTFLTLLREGGLFRPCECGGSSPASQVVGMLRTAAPSGVVLASGLFFSVHLLLLFVESLLGIATTRFPRRRHGGGRCDRGQ